MRHDMPINEKSNTIRFRYPMRRNLLHSESAQKIRGHHWDRGQNAFNAIDESSHGTAMVEVGVALLESNVSDYAMVVLLK